MIQVQIPGVGSPGTVKQQGKQWCAYSSTGAKLGCFTTEDAARAKAEQQSQSRIIELIGKTARLEERPVLQIVNVGDKASDGTKYEDIKLNTDDPQKADIWTYLDANDNGVFDEGTDPKYQLGPVVITGANLTKAAGGRSCPPRSVDPGRDAGMADRRSTSTRRGRPPFATETTKLAQKTSGDPTKQLAIMLDGDRAPRPRSRVPSPTAPGRSPASFTETAGEGPRRGPAVRCPAGQPETARSSRP